MLGSGDVRYDFIWRRAGIDSVLVTFAHHFDPIPGSASATLFDADADGPAADAAAGDSLVWRWSVIAGATPDAAGQYVIIPNGDGTRSNGRFPSITLPSPPPP